MIINETQDVYDVPGSARAVVKGLIGQATIVKTPCGTYSLILQFPTVGADDKEAKWVLGYLTDGQDT